jgi:hypothetical protein
MNRRAGAKKQTPTKRSKKAPATRKSSTTRKVVAAKPLELTAENSAYVAKLATALSEVSAAQNAWVQQVETASRNPALLQDAGCQSRLGAAMAEVVSAADGLRIAPVPAGMEAADAMLGRARAEATLAAATPGDGTGMVSTESIVASIQHLDEMSQLLQEAYRLIRG